MARQGGPSVNVVRSGTILDISGKADVQDASHERKTGVNNNCKIWT